MKKAKKYIYPFAFSATFLIFFAVLIFMLENVLPFPDGSYAPIAWLFLFLLALLLIAIPFYCVKYSKVISNEKSKFLFAFYNGLVLTLTYILPYCLEDETYIYGVILFVWVEIWTILPLVLRLIFAKNKMITSQMKLKNSVTKM